MTDCSLFVKQFILWQSRVEAIMRSPFTWDSVWSLNEECCSSGHELSTNLLQIVEAHKMHLCLGKHTNCSSCSSQYNPQHTVQHLSHTHRFPRLSDLYALSFEWHKYLSSLGFCTQPEHTYMAAEGDAGRFRGHPSDPTGNVYEHARLTSARIKASIKKMNNTNCGEVTSEWSHVIKTEIRLAAFG